MTLDDKIKIIQDLQCRHLAWLSKYNKALSYGTCPDSWIQNNIMISNLIKVVYRYRLFDDVVTNADSITINLLDTTAIENLNIQIAYGATTLATYACTSADSQESIADALCTLINAGSTVHKYFCIVKANVLYLYSFNGAYTYADSPTITYSESDVTTTELSISTTSIAESELGVILDLMNCLSFTEICSIITKLRNMLNNCNCK